MLHIILATQNAHKQAEFKSMIADKLHFQVSLFSDFIKPFDIEECGTSFAENALIKARAVYEKILGNLDSLKLDEFVVLAEDSGLCVEALDDEPGIFSARYASLVNKKSNSTDTQNLDCVIERLQAKGLTQSKAKFVANIAIITHCKNKNIEKLFCGELDGSVITHKLGSNGFGYDPIFVPTLKELSKIKNLSLENLSSSEKNPTLAQLGAESKNQISHRFKALQQVIDFLSVDF